MKDICIIVGAHPSNEQKTDILEKSLRSLQSSDLTIFTIAHAMPSRDLSSLCDYYLYDSNNEFIVKEELIDCMNMIGPHSYFASDNFVFRTHLDLFQSTTSHHYSAFLNVLNGAKLAKEKGFTHMFFTEGDNIFDYVDLENFKHLITNTEKRGLFFKPHSIDAISVLVFFIEVDLFLEKVSHVTSKAEWLRIAKLIDGAYTVEKIFSYLFRDCDLEILKTDSDFLTQYFPASATNILENSTDTTVPRVNYCSRWNPESNSDEYFIFYHSWTEEPQTVVSLIKVNGEEHYREEFSTSGRVYVYRKADLASLFEHEELELLNIYGEKQKSFTLSGSQFRSYLRLNTIHFVNS